MNTKKLGDFGERVAKEYLKNKGYKILDENYSDSYISGPKGGEIDIVAKKENIINFVEVKTLEVRPGSDRFSPEDKVNFQKQKKIIKTAQKWLMKNKISFDSKWQIDVISIKIDLNSKKAKIRHFKNV